MSSSSEDEEVLEKKATLSAFADEAKKLEEELKVAAHVHKRLVKDYAKAKARNTQLQDELTVLTSGSQALFLYIEQQRYRKMGTGFWLCVIITLFFTVGTLQRGSHAWALLNFIAFLFVWRGLYVETNAAPMAAAVCLALLTIKFA
jgi:hypothetical protein